MKHIVKRGGHMEPYDMRKLYASVYTAAVALREPAGAAELIAEAVVETVDQWLAKKHEVTSNDIRRVAHDRLKTINPAVAYLYKTQRVVW